MRVFCIYLFFICLTGTFVVHSYTPRYHININGFNHDVSRSQSTLVRPISSSSSFCGRHAPILSATKADAVTNGFDLLAPGVGIGAGAAGLVLLMMNRLTNMDTLVTDIQSRADIISVVACSALLLNVLSDSDIVARDRDAVSLYGFTLKEPVILLDDTNGSASIRSSIRWLIDTIMKTLPITSVHVIINDKCIGRGGVVSNTDDYKSTDLVSSSMVIIQKVLKNSEEVYLPDLQILPGKVEFTYLPLNTQSVCIIPIGRNTQRNSQTNTQGNGALVVATNQAKVLKLKDIAKLRSLVTILGNIMS